jgi:citrate lyase subunit beta/citryl-CoA lyase
MLFVPGHNQRYLATAFGSDADALIIDLEDSVPLAAKQDARGIASSWMQKHCFPRPVFIRINDADSGLMEEDIAAFVSLPITGFIIPKVCSAADVLRVDALLDGTNLALIPLIETTAAVLNLVGICTASPRIVAAALGAEDFITSLGGVFAPDGANLLVARTQLVLAARTTGILPIDTLHIRVHDLDELARDCTHSRQLGFEGMLCLHPKELSIIHQHYTPSAQQIALAEQMIEQSHSISRQGRQVAMVKGTFVGPPLVRRAQNLLHKAQLIAAREQI